MRSVVLLIAAALTALALPAVGQQIERSVAGVNGLSYILGEADIPQRRASPFVTREAKEFSLRILPLYDVDLEQHWITIAKDPEDMTQRNIRKRDLMTKISALPTVVVLPKWRRAFMDDEIAHESRLIPENELIRLWDQIYGVRPALRRKGATFATIPWDGGEVSLFHPQGILIAAVPKGCTSLLSDGKMAFVLSCVTPDGSDETRTVMVTDPDLMNNHGLSLGDNAAYTVHLIRDLLGDDARPVYVDTSSDILLDAPPVGYEKQSLGQFFTYPLSVFWGIFGALLLALFWRGWRRFGRPVPRQSDAYEVSQSAAIRAKARLLRLGGHDGPLVADFVRAQLGDLATQVFGPQGAGAGGQDRLFTHIARQDAALAREFKTSAQVLMASAHELPRSELYRKLDHYSSLLEKVADCHGTLRISGHRRRAAD